MQFQAKSPEMVSRSAARSFGRRPGSGDSLHPLLRMQQICGNHSVQRAVARAHAGEDISGVPADAAAAINRGRGGGRPLDEPAKTDMEAGFSSDFSKVRVHDDSESHALSRSLNARAFTTGQDVFFGEGQYRPGDQDGQRLIAHELTHTVQQPQAAELKAGDAVSHPHEPAEGEAERAADEVMSARNRA